MRTGRSSGLGKATEEVRALVPEPTRQGLMALAVVSGLSMSEFLRQELISIVHGRLTLLRLRQSESFGSVEMPRE